MFKKLLILSSKIDKKEQYKLADVMECLAGKIHDWDKANYGWVSPTGDAYHYDLYGNEEHCDWIRNNKNIIEGYGHQVPKMDDEQLNEHMIHQGWTRKLNRSYQISIHHWQNQIEIIGKHLMDFVHFNPKFWHKDTNISIEVTNDENVPYDKRYATIEFPLSELIDVNGNLMELIGHQIAFTINKMKQYKTVGAMKKSSNWQYLNNGWINPHGEYYDIGGEMEHPEWIRNNENVVEKSGSNIPFHRLEGIDLNEHMIDQGWVRKLNMSYDVSIYHWQNQIKIIGEHLMGLIYDNPNIFLVRNYPISIEIKGDNSIPSKFRYQQIQFNTYELIDANGDLLDLIDTKVAFIINRMKRLSS